MTNEKFIRSRIIKVIVVALILLTIGFLTFNKGSMSFNNLMEKAYQADEDALELKDSATGTAYPSSFEIEYVAYNNVARNTAMKVTAPDMASCELTTDNPNIFFINTKSTAWWIYTLDQGTASLILKRGTETKTYTVSVNASLTSLTIVDPTSNTEYPNKVLPANTTVQLGLKTVPDGAPTASIQWSSSDPSVIEVDSTGLITTHTKSGVDVTIRASNSRGDVFDTVVLSIEKVVATGVSISSNKVKYTIGETDQINATFTPSGASPDTIAWTSSNPSVISVDNDGNITAKAEGTTTISALVDGHINSNEITLTAIRGVDSITLNENKLELEKGANASLSVTYNPSNVDSELKGVNYKSANPLVASVDENGIVTAQGSGETTITATSISNSNAYATCTVNVTVPIKAIAANPSTITMKKGETADLNVEVTPEDTTDEKTFSYTSNNEDVATVKSTGKVTAVAEGQTTITVVHTPTNITCEATIIVEEEIIEENTTTENTTTENTVTDNTTTENTTTENIVAGNETTNNTVVDDNTVNENTVPDEPVKPSEPLEADSKSLVTGEKSQVNGKVQFDRNVDKEWELVITKNEITENLSNANVVCLYDIKIVKNGVEVPIKGENVRVTLQPTENLAKYSSIKVGYVENDQLVEMYNASYDGSYVSFNTKHLSEYAVVASETQNNELVKEESNSSDSTKASPQTGDINVALYLAAALGSLLGITFIIKYLKDME